MAGIGLGELLAVVLVVVLVVGAAAGLVVSGRWSRSRGIWTVSGAAIGAATMAGAAAPLPALPGSVSSAGGVWFLALAGAVGGGFLGWAWRPVDAVEARTWASRRGVDGLGGRGADLVRRYLRSSRGWRTSAIVLVTLAGRYLMELGNGLGGSSEPTARTAYDLSNGLGLPLAAALYGVAAIGVEVARRGERSGAAVLTPRSVTDYVNPFARGLQRVVLAVAIAAGALWLASPGEHVARAATAVVVTVAAVIIVELAQRRVVARPQRYADPEVILADDLARSSTAHALTGALVGAGFPTLAGVISDAARSWEGIGLTIAGLLSLVLSAVALGLWAGLGTSYASTVTRPVARDRDAEVLA